MPSFVRAVDDFLGTVLCDVTRPVAYGIRDLTGQPLDDWYRRNCNREPDPPPPPPFIGGQCPTEYLVTVTITETSTAFDTNPRVTQGSIQCFGPIASVGVNDACTQPNANQWFVVARNSQGNPQTFFSTAGISGCLLNPGQNLGQTSLSIGNIQVVRLDGQPDNCGPPPPGPPPAFPIRPPDQTITYNDNDNNSIDIDIGDISIGFPVEINGDFSFPISFTVDNPEINIPVEINVDLGFERDGDGEPIPVSRPRPPGNPRPPENDGDEPEDYSTPDYVEPNPNGEPDNEEPPPEEDCPATRPRPPVQSAIIRAVVVTVINPGTGVSEIFGVGDSDGIPIYVPAVGYVQFKVPVNAFQTAWLSDIPVKNARNLIPVPWEGGATEFAFVARSPDTEVRITPVYGSNEVTRPRDGRSPSCD